MFWKCGHHTTGKNQKSKYRIFDKTTGKNQSPNFTFLILYGGSFGKLPLVTPQYSLKQNNDLIRRHVSSKREWIVQKIQIIVCNCSFEKRFFRTNWEKNLALSTFFYMLHLWYFGPPLGVYLDITS